MHIRRIELPCAGSKEPRWRDEHVKAESLHVMRERAMWELSKLVTAAPSCSQGQEQSDVTASWLQCIPDHQPKNVGSCLGRSSALQACAKFHPRLPRSACWCRLTGCRIKAA